MPQFLLGLFFGSLFTGAELLGTLFLLPFAALFLAAIVWGGYEAVVWYDAASSAYSATAWYAWPWHWPGAHLAQQFFGLFTNAQAAEAQSGVVSQVFAWGSKLPQAMIAIGINLFVALIPVYLLGCGIRVLRWIRAGKRPEAVQSCADRS